MKETRKPLGLVIAELTDKNPRKDKRKETFYLLNISVRRSLTEMILTLRGAENLISLPTDKLFVFPSTNRNRFAYTLEKGFIYAFWYTKTHNSETKEDYFQVQDWRKLAPDKRYIERTLRLVLNQKETEEEEVITNKELLLELKSRIQAKSISFQISSANSTDKMPFELDTDLKDEESNFRINLLENNNE
jgi:hypothetical protein